VWNDAASLQATGGSTSIMRSLRELMLRDLPAQRQALIESIASGDLPTARANLHRLKAACGFCGASALLQVVDPLDVALSRNDSDPALLQAFCSIVDTMLDVGT
jgi:HPt (histidine-containing phosphotransfer) domain-containing protein